MNKILKLIGKTLFWIIAILAVVIIISAIAHKILKPIEKKKILNWSKVNDIAKRIKEFITKNVSNT